jgi:hypothetical protein
MYKKFEKFSANADWLFYVVDLLIIKYKMIKSRLARGNIGKKGKVPSSA